MPYMCSSVFTQFVSEVTDLSQTRNSGVAQWLACWAHNPKVRGSKPRSAIAALQRVIDGAKAAYGSTGRKKYGQLQSDLEGVHDCFSVIH